MPGKIVALRRHTRYVPIPTSVPASASWRFPLFAAFAAVWIVLAAAPVNRSDWLLENLLVLVAVPILIVTRKRLQFSNLAYSCLFAFFVSHAIGAHYTYSLVPYEQWAQALGGSIDELFGWQRNHYDRLIHFLYGALMMAPTVELLARVAPATGIWKQLLPIAFVTSHAAIYELLEWTAASIVAPELGNAYLGTQGDSWDAQKDMALALAGSVLAMLLLQFRYRRAERSDTAR
jgi:putative membrane protein